MPARRQHRLLPGLEVLEDRLTPSGQPTSLIGQPSSATMALSNQALILADSAVLSGGSSPTGSVAFTLYNPNGVLVDTETASVSGNGTYDTSTGYALPSSGNAVGTYQWDVAYSGDANNAPSSDNNDSGEQVVVSAASPVLGGMSPTTNNAGSGSLTNSPLTLQDSASLTGGYNETGTITFTLCNPAGTLVDTETASVNGDGTYSTPTGYALPANGTSVVGTYQWNVSYAGDANNASTSDNNDPAEQFVVSAASPVLGNMNPSTNDAGYDLLSNSPITMQDSASLTGGYNEGGTITFTLCNPAGTLVDTETVSVNGDGTYSTTTGFTLPSDGSSVIGTYQWNVSYSGDANNAPVSDMNDPAEQVVVSGSDVPTVTLSNPGNQTYSAGNWVSLNFYGSDSDMDALSYTATGLPSWLTIDASSGSISGTVPSDAATNGMPYSITVTATDTGANVSASQTITLSVNAPTVYLSNPGNQTYSAGNWVNLDFYGSDSDMDTLSYTATGLPSWLTIDSGSGTVSGTVPANAATDGDPYSITVTATDTGADVSASQTITLSVNAPTVYLSNPGNQTYSAGNWVSLDFYGSDSDMDTLSYTASGLPSWLSIGSSGTISGTIPSDAATNGMPYSITVTATDTPANVSASQTITLSVNAPTVYLSNPGNQTYSAGNWVNLDFYGSDSDMDTLSYTATGLPSWLTIDSGSGSISGTIPSNAATNGMPYSITVTATDTAANVSASQTITLTVNAPTVYLYSPGDQTYSAGNWVSLDFSGSDSDMDALTYTATGLPSWLTIDGSSGSISGTVPGYAATNGTPYSITVTATDTAADVSASQTITLSVNAPTVYLSNPGNQTYSAGNWVNLDFYGSDSDMDTLSYTATGLPSWLTIDSGSGSISGTIPSNAATNGMPYSITVTATDTSANVSTSQTITLSVNAPTVYLYSPGDQTYSAGNMVSLDFYGSDSDMDTLTYTATGLPSWLTIDSGSGLISGTVPGDAATNGTPYSITVTATDVAAGVSTSQTIDVTVTAPTVYLYNPGTLTNSEGDLVNLALSATDSAGDALEYTAVNLPQGLVLDDTTGVVSGTIWNGASLSGPYSVTVTATDSMDPNAGASQSFTWNVNPVVTLTNPGSTTGADGDTVYLPLTATDSAGNAVNYSATGLPAGLSINSSTGIISGTVSVGDNMDSPYSVTVTATDSVDTNASASQPFQWTINPTGTITVALTQPGTQTNFEGDTPTLALSASDSASNALIYTAVNLPPGLVLNPSTGVVSGTVYYYDSAGGPYTVTVIATDTTNPSVGAYQNFTWNVHPLVTLTAAPSSETNADGDTVYLPLTATDSTGNALAWSVTEGTLPAGLTINPATGLISGTISAGADADSPYTVTVAATDSVDSGGTASQTIDWTVNATGTIQVTLTQPADQTKADGDTASLSISATDSADNALIYEALNLPCGLSIAPLTGLISGTITNGASANGPYTVTIIALDSTNPDAGAGASFQWAVAPAVTLGSVPAQTNAIGDSVYLPTVATDSAYNSLTYSAEGLPDGLAIDPCNGTIYGIVSNTANTAEPYTVTVTATDSEGAEATTPFAWNINPAPAITITFETAEDTSITIEPATLLANDPNAGPGSTVAITSLPQYGFWTCNNDGSWTYTPVTGYSGRDLFTYTITNANESVDDGVAAIDVDPDVQFVTNDFTADQGTATTITVALTGAATQAVTVQYSTANCSAQAGMDYQAASGTLTIPAGQLTASFTINILDNPGAADGAGFRISLSNANHASLCAAARAQFNILAVQQNNQQNNVAALNQKYGQIEDALSALIDPDNGGSQLNRISSQVETLNDCITGMKNAQNNEQYDAAAASFSNGLAPLGRAVNDLNAEANRLINLAREAGTLAQGMKFRVAGILSEMVKLSVILGEVVSEIGGLQSGIEGITRANGQGMRNAFVTTLGGETQNLNSCIGRAVAVYQLFINAAIPANANHVLIHRLNAVYVNMKGIEFLVNLNGVMLRGVGLGMDLVPVNSEPFDSLLATYDNGAAAQAALAVQALNEAKSVSQPLNGDDFAEDGYAFILKKIDRVLEQDFNYVDGWINANNNGLNNANLTTMQGIADELESAHDDIDAFLG